MRRGATIVLVVGLVVASWLVWRWLFPSDETAIRRLVNTAVAQASWAEQDGNINRLVASERLAALCTPDVVVLMEARGVHSRRLQGREELRQAVLAARAEVAWLGLSVDGVEVSISDSGTAATVLLAATVRMDRLSEPLLQDYKLALSKLEGDWLLSRVEPVRGFGQ